MATSNNEFSDFLSGLKSSQNELLRALESGVKPDEQ